MALTKRGDKKAPTGRGTMAGGGQGQGYGMSLAIKQFKINNAIPANPQNHQFEAIKKRRPVSALLRTIEYGTQLLNFLLHLGRIKRAG
jgi:hypothetical protein